MRIPKSIKFEMVCHDKIKRIADASFEGNFNRAINWIIYSKMTEEDFYRFMAKHHAGQMNHYRNIIEHHEETVIKQKQKVLA